MNVLVNTYAGAVEGSLDVAALRTIMDVLVSSCPRCTRRQRERAGPDQATARHCRARKRDERLRASTSAPRPEWLQPVVQGLRFCATTGRHARPACASGRGSKGPAGNQRGGEGGMHACMCVCVCVKAHISTDFCVDFLLSAAGHHLRVPLD